MLRDETQISTAGLHASGFGFEFMPGEVQVYFLGAEFEGVALWFTCQLAGASKYVGSPLMVFGGGVELMLMDGK